MRTLVGLLASACLLTAIACSTGDTGQGGGGATGGGAGGGGATGGGGGSAGGGAGGGSAGGGSAGGGAGGGSAGGGAGGGGGGGGAPDAGNPRLLGITWNGNMQMDAGQSELRRIDPQTGSSTLVAAIPGLEFFYSGGTQTTDGRGLLYVVSYSLTGGGPRLLTIDANTGAVLRSPGFDRPAAGDYNWSGGLHLRPDAGLVGVTWNGPTDAGSEELRTINPVTGNTTLVAALPGMDWVLGGANASDPSRDVAYAVAFSNADARARLFSLRLTSGQVVANPVIDGGASGLVPFVLFPRSNGSLRALVSPWAGDAGTGVAELNPTTGALSQVSALSTDGIAAQAFDAVGERAYFVDDQSRLITLNVATGAVVSSPTLAPNDAGVSFHFGGGLYFVR